MPKKLEILSLKIYIKMLEFKEKDKNSLNKGTKHKKNYMGGLKSTNKHLKGGGSP